MPNHVHIGALYLIPIKVTYAFIIPYGFPKFHIITQSLERKFLQNLHQLRRTP